MIITDRVRVCLAGSAGVFAGARLLLQICACAPNLMNIVARFLDHPSFRRPAFATYHTTRKIDLQELQVRVCNAWRC